MSAAAPSMESALWAPWAWVDGRWQSQVLLPIQPDGRWGAITSGVVQPPDGARVLQGALVPSLVNAHSHAFQRAMAGLTEVREHAGEDDFWSWREAMYAVALSISPEQLKQVATRLYRELLRGVRYEHSSARTQSLVMRSKSGTVRMIDARHRIDKLRDFAAVDY